MNKLSLSKASWKKLEFYAGSFTEILIVIHYEIEMYEKKIYLYIQDD